MSKKIRAALIVPLAIGVVIGMVITVNIGHQALATESSEATSKAAIKDNTPRGRTAVAIIE